MTFSSQRRHPRSPIFQPTTFQAYDSRDGECEAMAGPWACGAPLYGSLYVILGTCQSSRELQFADNSKRDADSLRVSISICLGPRVNRSWPDSFPLCDTDRTVLTVRVCVCMCRGFCCAILAFRIVYIICSFALPRQNGVPYPRCAHFSEEK